MTIKDLETIVQRFDEKIAERTGVEKLRTQYRQRPWKTRLLIAQLEKERRLPAGLEQG